MWLQVKNGWWRLYCPYRPRSRMVLKPAVSPLNGQKFRESVLRRKGGAPRWLTAGLPGSGLVVLVIGWKKNNWKIWNQKVWGRKIQIGPWRRALSVKIFLRHVHAHWGASSSRTKQPSTQNHLPSWHLPLSVTGYLHAGEMESPGCTVSWKATRAFHPLGLFYLYVSQMNYSKYRVKTL